MPTITWTNAGVLPIGRIRTNFNEIWIVIFIQENAVENVVCQNGGHLVQVEMTKEASDR